jgi:(p)ppGpp synthase/HD superfamily hydrolase
MSTTLNDGSGPKRPPVFKKEDMDEIMNALCIASEWHVDQRRKDERGSPYINHLIDVFRSVYAVTQNKWTLVAAILHDIIEETPCTYSMLDLMSVSKDAIDVIREITENKSMSFTERKKWQTKMFPKLLKLLL